MTGQTNPSPPSSSEAESTAPSSFLPPISPSLSNPRLRTASSPLNPHAASASSSSNPAIVQNPFARNGSTASRPGSRSSSVFFAGLGSDPSTPLPTSVNFRGDAGTRGSMVLYRLATDADSASPLLSPSGREHMSEKIPPSPKGYLSLDDDALLPPPRLLSSEGRDSTYSNRSSTYSLDDSKYPAWTGAAAGLDANPAAVNRQSAFIFRERGLVPYAYDPLEDDNIPGDPEDDLHDPEKTEAAYAKNRPIPWRGLLNVSALLLLIVGLLLLFVFYPVYQHFITDASRIAMGTDPHINGTGQATLPMFHMPELIDKDTPEDVKKITGMNGDELELVFSDEFETDGRSFYPGDDPWWEAVDLWYGVTADMEWYDPSQITTKDGSLIITMDSTNSTTRTVPESTAPFTAAENHELEFRSGMLQSWNKMCYTSGYIEVAIILPGADETNQGYWPGAWTMANLGRPGYPGTTDGMWPYSYDSCDVGTFPNQTYRDGSGPPAALESQWGRSKYNYELSWLPGQRLSACTCTSETDHPGPLIRNETSGEMRYRGRGVPELDILEDQFNKITDEPYHVVSQSAQFAPFTRDYVYGNSSDEYHKIYDHSLTTENTYKGSAIQQAVSSLTRVPSDGYQGLPNRRHIKFGFEYEPNPDDPENGWIIWEVNGNPSHRMNARALGPDPIDELTMESVTDADGTALTGSGLGGSGVSQRIVPQEPLSVVLNLGISKNWQTIDMSTLIFPAQMFVDYVRVYQKPGQTNVGCSPPDYPTADYIERHWADYNDKNSSTWAGGRLKNREYDGC